MSSNTLLQAAKLLNLSAFSEQAQTALEAAISQMTMNFNCSRQQAIYKLYVLLETEVSK